MTQFLNDTPLKVAAAFAVVLATLLVALNIADARPANELGKTPRSPSPNCPAREKPPGQPTTERDVCQVTGQVTGFQKSAEGRKGLFRAKRNGTIVAWSVDLANPSRSERQTFGEAAQTPQDGKAPTAGISIIRRTGPDIYRLKNDSPVIPVRTYYGDRPIFTLDTPLRVRKGDIVALTTNTWLPAFSIKGQDRNDAWIASRRKRNCEVPNSVPPERRLDYFFDHTSPHRERGTTRPYECTYKSARILYWAYFVPES